MLSSRLYIVRKNYVDFLKLKYAPLSKFDKRTLKNGQWEGFHYILIDFYPCLLLIESLRIEECTDDKVKIILFQ